MERTVDWESEASGIIPEFSEDWLCAFEPADFSEYASLRTNEGNGSIKILENLPRTGCILVWWPSVGDFW